MTGNSYGDVADEYRKLGWLGTLPLPPGEKFPPPKDFTGSGRPYPTQSQVADWVKGKGRSLLPVPFDPSKGNLALRLADVPEDVARQRTDLPFAYCGNNVDGWEFFGIDIDQYKDKKGAEERAALEAELGELPATALSTARWGTGSCIAVYLVPKGYRYMGKASPAIEIVQKRHRFMVAHPSTNPDAGGSQYIWRYGKPCDAHDVTAMYSFDHPLGIPDPATDDVAILPEKWFDHLSRGGTIETDDPISDLTDDELFEWAKSLRYEDDPCSMMERTLAQCLEKLESSESSHDKITYAHWRLFNLAAEGHAGLKWALDQFHPAWAGHVSANRGDLDAVGLELNRSALGALDKIQPFYNGLGRPDDTCAVDKSAFDTDGWADRLSDAEQELLEEADFGGLGPVVGRMPLGAPKPASEYGRHDDGNGQHFVDLYGSNVKYISARKSWILWDGSRWYRDHDDRLIKAAFRRVRMRQEAFAAEMRAIAASDPEDKESAALAKAWSAWAKGNGDNSRVRNALEMARHCYVGDETVVLDASELDGNPVLLGCANGIIDLSADEIDVRPPRKEDYVTYNTNVDYISWRSLVNGEGGHFEAFAIWQEYLNWFLPNKELQLFVRKALGHMLVGENPEKKIVFLYGPADSGKSTMIGAIAGALGDYYGTIDMSLFKQRDLNPALVRAVPLRITGMSEMENTSKTGIIDAAVVKRLTGNDKITAELKYSNEIFEGRPQFTTVIACNNPPEIPNADAALYGRLLVLPLERPVSKSQKKYERQKQIERICGPAVLAWLIEGWKDYQREGLEPESWPAVVKRENRHFASEINGVARYINEHLIIAAETSAGKAVMGRAKARAAKRNKKEASPADYPIEWTPEASMVYQHYRMITSKNGDEPVDMQQFTRDLGVGRTRQRKVDGKNTSVYVGVKFKNEPPQSVAERTARKW